MKIFITLLTVLLGLFHSLVGSFVQQASVPVNHAINTVVAAANRDLPAQVSSALGMGPTQTSSQPPIYRQRILRPNVRRLPRNIATNAKASAGKVTVLAGDSGVSQSVVSGAGQIIQSISLPTLQAKIGRSPSQSIDIVLFSTPRSYAAELEKAGVAPGSISSFVNNTGGITVNSDIWIPLYALQDKADLADVLTHELTHVVFNQMGIGQELPTWLNEGTAWYDGLSAQAGVDAAGTQAQISALQASVLQAVAYRQSLPLTANESQILNAPYNVEFEDYMAVQNLLKSHGAAAFKTFISHSAAQGVSGSFASQFGVSMNAYAQSFYASLQQSAQQTVRNPQAGAAGSQIVVVPGSSAAHYGRSRFWSRLAGRYGF